MIGRIIADVLTDRRSLVSRAARRMLGRLPGLSASRIVSWHASARPHYAHCIYHAARLAKRLHLDAVSVVEFGVAGGNGLIFIEEFAEKVAKEFGIRIEAYGFDLGSGLTEPQDERDLPYWFRSGMYEMDRAALERRLRFAKLIIGDVRDTVGDFLAEYKPAPIGAIFNDLDYYSSTVDCLKLFDGDAKYFLPRIFFYLDDVIGQELAMYGACNGELLAISEFNKRNERKKIVLNQDLIARSNAIWRYQVYYYHDFDHPRYSHYVGGDEQERIVRRVKLKR